MPFRTIKLAPAALGLALCGCLPWIGLNPEAKGSVGAPSKGLLRGGGHLPAKGEHFRFYHARDRRFGSSALTEMIERVADRVAEEHPGSILLVGDISDKSGGFITEHQSHRSGRDVDFAFFRNELGKRRSEKSPAMIRFDRFGAGVRDHRAFEFDAARNWSLVEALLHDPEAEIQWIFASDGLKALMLEWALDHDRDVELIERAATVLRQPSDSAAHDDHFHVRIYCDQEDAYCVDTGPKRPWISPPKSSPLKFTLEELVKLALEED